MGWLSLSNLLPGFVDFIIKGKKKKKPINIPNLCLSIKEADNIYTILHTSFISYLVCLSKRDTCHRLQRIILEMKWPAIWREYIVQCDWFQAYVERRSDSKSSVLYVAPLFYNFFHLTHLDMLLVFTSDRNSNNT